MVRRWCSLLVALLATLAVATPAPAAEKLALDPIVDGAIVAGWAAVSLGTPLIAPDPTLLTSPATSPPGFIDSWAPLEKHGEFGKASDHLRLGALIVGGAAVAADGLFGGDSFGDRLLVDGAIFAESMLLTSALTNATKVLTLRTRPYAYTEPGGKADDVHSFASGHTSAAAAATFTAARLIDRQNDLSPAARIGLYGGATAITAGVGALRVAAGMHFPTDVLAGAALGAGIGILLPTLHEVSSVSVAGGTGPSGSVQLGIAGTF